jgi:hypothetical protein
LCRKIQGNWGGEEGEEGAFKQGVRRVMLGANRNARGQGCQTNKASDAIFGRKLHQDSESSSTFIGENSSTPLLIRFFTVT